jgi:aspartate-semialdehyde dehydrogenase
VPAPTSHRAQLAGNVITLDWTLDPNGYTEEENKVINETKKILGDASIGVNPTCVRVPVKVAHSESINVEFHRQVSVEEAKEALAKAPGVVLMDESKGEFPQPLHAAGSDHTFVGRVRQDPSSPTALSLWVVADNLRKGAASNAVQCAQELVRLGIVK